MSIHGVIDEVALGLGAKFMPKYFREGIESPGIREHLKEVKLLLPEVRGEGDYELTAKTLVGELNAAFRLAQWVNKNNPTIIYHHGASEIPFDYGFRGIFPYKKQNIKANLFLVRAPFHRTIKEFQAGIRTMSNVMAMLAVSVSIIEQLVEYNREQNVPRVLVAGTSLGGFITNLHHIHYNSADVYTPLLAGTAMNEAYLRSSYSRAVASQAKANPDKIDSVLNFEEDFARMDNRSVFPLLACFDRIIRFERQKASYGDCPVVSFNKGHTTGALSYSILREHVLKHLNDL